jgi:hypothetical protein
MSDRSGARWLWLQILTFTGKPIKPFAISSLTSQRPQRIAKMLLHERDFCLHCHFNIL